MDVLKGPRSKASKGLVLCVVAVFMTGCATFQGFSTWMAMSPLNKAKTSSQGLTTWLETTSSRTIVAYTIAQPEMKLKYDQYVFPAMKRFGTSLQIYIGCIETWDQYKIKPPDIDTSLNGLKAAQDDINRAIAAVAKGGS